MYMVQTTQISINVKVHAKRKEIP